MADTYDFTANVNTGTEGTGEINATSVITTNISQGTSVTANVTTGGVGATGPQGPAGADGTDGPSDHTLLTNIGTNTHAQIDTAISNSASHIANTSNPHSVTKTQVGLGNVDNTSDVNKPISTATQTALAGKVDKTGDVMTGSLTATTLTAGTATDVLGTALSVIRNNVAVGRIDNNASGLRVQAQNGSLQLRGTGNTGIAIDASGNAVVAGTITGANLSGTNTGDQPLGSRTITGTTNQITVTNGDGVSGNPTLSLPQDIHTGAIPTFAGVRTSATGGTPLYSNYMGASIFSTPIPGYTNAGLQIVYASNTAVGDRPIVGAVRTRGTLISPTAVQTGDEIFSFLGAAHDGTDLQYPAEIKFKVDAAVSAGNIPTSVGIYSGANSANRSMNLQVNSSGTTQTKILAPFTDSTYTLGTSSRYWSNTYTDRLYLNSTAYLDGGTAGRIAFTGHLASASNYGSDLGTTGGAFATVRAGVFRADYAVGLAFAAGSNIQMDTATGTKIGTATAQKIGFWNATPVVQQVLATGASHTVDDVITVLQNLGLVRQS